MTILLAMQITIVFLIHVLIVYVLFATPTAMLIPAPVMPVVFQIHVLIYTANLVQTLLDNTVMEPPALLILIVSLELVSRESASLATPTPLQERTCIVIHKPVLQIVTVFLRLASIKPVPLALETAMEINAVWTLDVFPIPATKESALPAVLQPTITVTEKFAQETTTVLLKLV